MKNQLKTLFVLGGGLVKDETGRWRTIDLGQGDDKFAAMNDRWRVDAAFALWEKDPSIQIMVSAGQGQYNGTDAPTVASVMERELLELGVTPQNLRKDEVAGSTLEQLRTVSDWSLWVNNYKLGEIFILTNEWHLPRVEAMINHAPGTSMATLKKALEEGRVKLVSAEEILLSSDAEKWKEKIKYARSMPAMQARYEMEKKGRQQIIDGTYKWS